MVEELAWLHGGRSVVLRRDRFVPSGLFPLLFLQATAQVRNNFPPKSPGQATSVFSACRNADFAQETDAYTVLDFCFRTRIYRLSVQRDVYFSLLSREARKCCCAMSSSRRLAFCSSSTAVAAPSWRGDL